MSETHTQTYDRPKIEYHQRQSPNVPLIFRDYNFFLSLCVLLSCTYSPFPLNVFRRSCQGDLNKCWNGHSEPTYALSMYSKWCSSRILSLAMSDANGRTITLMLDCRYLSDDHCNIFSSSPSFASTTPNTNFLDIITSHNCKWQIFARPCISGYTFILYMNDAGISHRYDTIRTTWTKINIQQQCELQTFVFTHTSEPKLHDSQIYARCVLTRDSWKSVHWKSSHWHIIWHIPNAQLMESNEAHMCDNTIRIA